MSFEEQIGEMYGVSKKPGETNEELRRRVKFYLRSRNRGSVHDLAELIMVEFPDVVRVGSRRLFASVGEPWWRRLARWFVPLSAPLTYPYEEFAVIIRRGSRPLSEFIIKAVIEGVVPASARVDVSVFEEVGGVP